MADNKRRPKKRPYIYTCPYCGNEAPFKMRYDRGIKCFYCKCTYTKNERVKVYVDTMTD